MIIKLKWGTHKQIVYDYLMKGNKITTRDAMIDLGVGDLQGTIRDLKKAGVQIKDKKANIKSMIALQEQMSTKELITKHTL